MYRLLTIDEKIFINQFTQKIHNLDTMLSWFEKFDAFDKRAILSNLLNMVIQSHPTYQDVEKATDFLGKRLSPSANILLSKTKPLSKFGYRVLELAERELSVGFSILLLTLSLADERRRKSEDPAKCCHWWHKDLSDPDYISFLRGQLEKNM